MIFSTDWAVGGVIFQNQSFDEKDADFV